MKSPKFKNYLYFNFGINPRSLNVLYSYSKAPLFVLRQPDLQNEP